MRNFFLLLITGLILVGCTKKNKPPIESSVMEKMLTDMQYAEVYSMMVNDSTHQARNKNMDSMALYYNSIFKHYGISKEKFIEGVEWYRRNPEELDSVYARMIPVISKDEGVSTTK